MKYFTALAFVVGLAAAQSSSSTSTAAAAQGTFTVIAEGNSSPSGTNVANAAITSGTSGPAGTAVAAAAAASAPGTVTIIAGGGSASPQATGGPIAGNNMVVAGTGTDGQGQDCGCNCLCGMDAVPQNLAINNFGGYVGVMPAS